MKTVAKGNKRKYKKRKRRKTPRIVRHHITYEPEWKVAIYDGEHMILTRIQWRKRVSRGFITALKHWINHNAHEAVDLDKEVK